MTVEQFFTQYAALSMGDDHPALAAMYAPSFFVAGPKGSMDVRERRAVAYLMERVAESWRVLGYISASDQEEEMRALGLL